MLGDVIGQFLAETVLLGLGRAVALLALPSYDVEDLAKMRTARRGVKAGFSYERNGQRYLYLESVQLLGLAALLVLGLLILVGVYLLP